MSSVVVEQPSTGILLVEDHPVIRIGLRTIIESQPDLHVVAEATGADSARRLNAEHRPELVLLPMRLEGTLKGIELCRELVASAQAPYVIIYTSFNSPDDASMSFLSGAHSFIHKSEQPADVLATIYATVQGRRVWLLGADRPRALETQLEDGAFTQREREVLGLMLQHLSNAQIAAELFIEVSTVKTHVRSILAKLGVESRRELLQRDSGRRLTLSRT